MAYATNDSYDYSLNGGLLGSLHFGGHDGIDEPYGGLTVNHAEPAIEVEAAAEEAQISQEANQMARRYTCDGECSLLGYDPDSCSQMKIYTESSYGIDLP